MDGFDENAAVTRRMVDALARTVTGCSDTRAAWREFAGTDTRVGIKVTASGGPYFSTRRGIVAAVVAGLRDAGVREIIVWDKMPPICAPPASLRSGSAAKCAPSIRRTDGIARRASRHRRWGN